MKCKDIVKKEITAYLDGKSDLTNLKLVIMNNCPNSKERATALKEAKVMLEKFFEKLS